MLIQLPQKFSASFVTRTFFPDEYKEDRSRINYGMCYDWAYIAYCLWGNVKLWTSEYHAWVQVGKKFYDSESFQGVWSPGDLQCSRRSGYGTLLPTYMEAEEFCRTWTEYNDLEDGYWDNWTRHIQSRGVRVVRT